MTQIGPDASVIELREPGADGGIPDGSPARQRQRPLIALLAFCVYSR
jgi:hypothetical protein